MQLYISWIIINKEDNNYLESNKKNQFFGDTILIKYNINYIL